MQNSKIEWCDHTFNPWHGCQRVSPGCEHCYAEVLNRRYGYDNWGPAKTTPRRMMSESYWRQPVRWNAQAEQAGQRARVFCASMADVFEDHPDVVEARQRLFELIGQTPHLDWLLLTKRPENILPLTRRAIDPFYGPLGNECAEPNGLDVAEFDQLFPNVWLGTSVEDQQRADERIPELLKVPARVRFLSCEPLLGPLDLSRWLPDIHTPIDQVPDGDAPIGIYDPFTRERYPDPAEIEIHWIICGGESGPGARPMHPNWARQLRDQCVAAGVSFFFKQWGEYCPGEFQRGGVMNGYWEFQQGRSFHEAAHGPPEEQRWQSAPDGDYRKRTIIRPWPDVACVKLGKAWSGRMLDCKTWSEFPEVRG